MVYGFMQAMDAEKDPRNLTIAFRCACHIAQHFPVGESFFGLCYCDHMRRELYCLFAIIIIIIYFKSKMKWKLTIIIIDT